MEKTIEINGQSVTLNNCTEWLFIYNDQFGHDIVPVIMPAISGLVQVIGGMLESLGASGLESVGVEDVAKLYDSDAMQSALVYFGAMQITDIVNLTWAMAKAADDSIPGPREWAKRFDSFPLDVLGPVLIEMIISGFSSSKNWERLQTAIGNLKPKKTTKKK